LSDWDYQAIDCSTADGLAVLLKAVEPDWAGFSCTMPLKRFALECADQADPLAVAIGAANTLLPSDGGWRAAITDVAGIVLALAEHGVAPGETTILGAGGTAQAALGALAEFGVRECRVLVRDLARTVELRGTADRLGITLAIAQLEEAAPALAADLIISTLPAGAADGVTRHAWRAAQALLDVVYDHWPTPLAQAASRAGSTVISGALMLLHQAAEQVVLMTGEPAPIGAMRAALRAAAPNSGI
jgi:shikimate dehydrogenase